MTLVTHLNFPGNCEEAFRFYADVLDGEIRDLVPFSKTPASDHVPEDWRDKIWQARLRVGATEIMATDTPPHMFLKPQGFGVTINIDDPEQAKVVFDRLSDGGSIAVDLHENFWARKFGIVTDRFGTPWVVNCA